MHALAQDAPGIGSEFAITTQPSDISGAVVAIALLSLSVCALAVMLGNSIVPRSVWALSGALNLALICTAMTCRRLTRHR